MPRYIDIDLRFAAHPVTGDIGKLRDKASVDQALKNIVFSMNGDWAHDSELGADVYDSLFRTKGAADRIHFATSIENAIRNNEPRVSSVSVRMVQDPDDLHTLRAVIQYFVINIPSAQTLGVPLSRVR